MMHKVFISYHHKNDQIYKDEIIKKFSNEIFIDGSVDTGDISDDLSDEKIRELIRDNYLKDTTVTIVLVGTETKFRKHIDWEIYSSMFDGKVNKKSGIIIINLPTIEGSQISICDEDKEILEKGAKWSPIKSYEKFDYLPKRLLDNIKDSEVKINIVNYNNIINNKQGFEFLIEKAYENKLKNNYDLSSSLRRRNN